MSTPGLPSPPNVPEILLRQPGETLYGYRNRRSVTLTGETLYQRRIRQARARGLTTTEARGHRPGEAERRRRITIADYGLTPWQLWRRNQVQWLIENGYTPESTGWSWNKLIRFAPRLRWLVNNTAPGAQILPSMLLEAKQFEAASNLPSGWSEEALNEKYFSTFEYVQQNDNRRGRWHWFQDRIPEMPVQWWYYHP